MLECPECSACKNKAIECRDLPGALRRRRECSECGHRWTTYEMAISPPPADNERNARIVELYRKLPASIVAARIGVTVRVVENVVRREGVRKVGVAR